jgi:exo-beta-1,3-glucanase (GH17 family)
MKYLVQTAYAAALIGLSSQVYAAVNGINYDPVHNPAWEPARVNDNLTKMREILQADFKQIQAMGFTAIKTYYSRYCSNVPRCIDVAEEADKVGLKVMLGVFEFRPGHNQGCDTLAQCESFTKPQVDGAINQANKYTGTVRGIVVGNEDMFDDNGPNNKPRFTPDRVTQGRIVADITTIKGQVSIPVTTAQRQNDWCGGTQPGCDPTRTDSLNQSDPKGVLKTVTTIGVNIFPYWGGQPETIMPPPPPNGPCHTDSGKPTKSVACQTQATALAVLNAVQKPIGEKIISTVNSVVVTEEGWPDCANSPPQPATSLTAEIDYFGEWNTLWSTPQNQSYDSYYFMAYDLAPSCTGDGSKNDDADKHFGLCSKSGATKDPRLKQCS